jgi:hypothetical protein
MARETIHEKADPAGVPHRRLVRVVDDAGS